MIEKEEYLKKLNEFFPSGSDDDISKIEYFSDFYDSASNKENSEYTKEKFEQLDNEWRERYRNRFFGGGKISEEEKEIELDDAKPKRKYEDLFIKKEGN